jgi:hypothetical protein
MTVMPGISRRNSTTVDSSLRRAVSIAAAGASVTTNVQAEWDCDQQDS